MLLRVQKLSPERIGLSCFYLVHRLLNLCFVTRLGYLDKCLCIIPFFVHCNLDYLFHLVLRNVGATVNADVIHEVVKISHNIVLHRLQVLELRIDLI